jgi:hypothetical protein
MAYAYDSSSEQIDIPAHEIIADDLERFEAVQEALMAAYYDRLDRGEGPAQDDPYRVRTERFRLSEGFAVPFLTPPLRIRLKSAGKRLPDVMPTAAGSAITQKVIDLIEDIEPGVHRYHPIEVMTKDGAPVAEARFLLNMCSRLDTIYVEKSNVFYARDVDMYLYGNGHRSIFVHKERVAGHAIWHEYKAARDFVSDAFAERFKAQNMRGLQFLYYCPEI